MAVSPNYSSPAINPSELLGRPQFQNFIASALEFRNNSDWKGNKRFFLTLFPNSQSFSNPTPYVDGILRTKITGSFGNSVGSLKSDNLAELSTGEIIGIDTTANSLTISDKNTFNQNYGAIEATSFFESTPPAFISGSYMISRLNDDNPSLLIELNKDQQLPDNTGDKEFVILPEDLHPFVKDNLEFFLTRAGINVGGDTSQFIELDETNRNLP